MLRDHLRTAKIIRWLAAPVIRAGFCCHPNLNIGTLFMRTIRILGLAVLLAATLAGCGGSGNPVASSSNVVPTAKMNDLDLNAILAAAKDGDTITMPAGKFTMRGPLQIANKKNLTLVGAGNGTDPAKATILTFKNALTQNGISASNTNGITFKNFAVEDASGNGLFVTSSNGVTMDTMRAEWTTDPINTSTMAYGLYPVRCDNVVVTNSIVVGTRDAGVYVGQSTNIRVTKNDVYLNVAGVEIENSHNAVVEDNYVHQNTGGILVFALTGPTRFLDTKDVVVRNNKIIDNNIPPAHNAQGLVLIIPPGTGVMVLASSNVDVSNNTITNHKTTGVMVISSLAAGIYPNPATKDEQGKPYNPYPSGVYVHANTVSDFGSDPGAAFKDPAGLAPFTQGFMGFLALNKQPMNFPAVLWDGIVNPYVPGTNVNANGSGGQYSGDMQICSKGNTIVAPAGATGFSYENLDLDLIGLMNGAPAPNFPNPARMDCTINLTLATGT